MPSSSERFQFGQKEDPVMHATNTMKNLRLLVALGAVTLASVSIGLAQQAKDISLTYKGKQFHPAEINAPANTPLNIRVRNQDAQAMEFESDTLRVEKVIKGNSEATVSVRALAPGRYEFYDEMSQGSNGYLNVK
jgi:hypothetical protein